ncbi:MAG: serine/threonine protein phosphatase [Chlorobi bacterium]|nr:serine/threonine protein phosphatase [Chlorobiota bacterium]
MHQSLSENRRIIAVGDIHGCLHSLERLVGQIGLRHDDQLVFLGDYIDRGPRSGEVVDFLISLRQCHTCFFLMGNHELMYLDYLETRDPSLWLSNGGCETLLSYGSRNGLDLPEEHIGFIRACRLYIETEHYFFTHGGLDPELSVRDNLRNHKPEKFCLLRLHMNPSILENSDFPWEKTLVCAHTPIPNPLLQERLIAIDTGCVYHNNPLLGKLTAVMLPERRIVQTNYLD